MLAPVNHPLMGSFFTLRCHYLSHPRAQGLEVLVAAPFMVGGDLGDWRRGHPGLHMTRLQLRYAHSGRKSPLCSRPPLLPGPQNGTNPRQNPGRAGRGHLTAQRSFLLSAGVLADLILIKDICSVTGVSNSRLAQTRSRIIYSPPLNLSCIILHSIQGTQLEGVRFGVQMLLQGFSDGLPKQLFYIPQVPENLADFCQGSPLRTLPKLLWGDLIPQARFANN